MSRFSRPPRLPLIGQPIAGLIVGGLGAAILSVLTSRGYLHAAVVTGAGYTGRTEPLGPGEQLLMLFAWLLVGGLAGWTGRSGLAFAGLWLGAMAGSVVGFLGDPDGNILWLDLVVTVVGVTIFLTPGFVLGAALAGWREAREPDGSGKRPTPPPLWARGARRAAQAAADRRAALPPSVTQPAPPPASYAPSSYARPGSSASE